MTELSENKVTIKIPRPLYRRLKEIISGSGFDSVTDFIVYVLRDIAANVDKNQIAEDPDQSTLQLTAQEIESVRRRLQKLGYL